MGVSIWQIVILFVLFWPLIHVIFSNRSHGGAKFGWALAAFLFSWLVYIVFLIVTQSNKDKNVIEARLDKKE